MQVEQNFISLQYMVATSVLVIKHSSRVNEISRLCLHGATRDLSIRIQRVIKPTLRDLYSKHKNRSVKAIMQESGLGTDLAGGIHSVMQ